jgi:hypothetical protein
VIPMVKPRAFAASYAADRLDWVLSNRRAAWPKQLISIAVSYIIVFVSESWQARFE